MPKFYINYLLLAGTLFLATPLWSKPSSDPLITEIQVNKGDSLYRQLYLYNGSGHKTLETKYVMRNDAWARREQTEWIYDGDVCKNQYIRHWNNSTWEMVHQINFTYANGLLQSELHLQYGEGTYTPTLKKNWIYLNGKTSSQSDSTWVNSAWIISSKNDYKYNSTSGNLDTLLFSKYNNGILLSTSKITFLYNEENLIYKQTYSEKQDTLWINSFETTHYYLASQQKKYQTQRIWNNDTKKWVNSQNISYTYTASGNVKTETYQKWNAQYWENDLQYEYTYNNDNNLIKKINYMPIYDDFRVASTINYSDFVYGKASLIEASYEFWGGDAGSLINTFIPFQFNTESAIQYGSRVKISYIPVNETGVTTLTDTTKKGLIDVYPNPSTGIFYFNIQKYDVNSWIITDIAGKTIQAKSLEQKTGVIDLTDCQSGIYLLRVFTKQGTLSQKLIKK